MAKLLVTQRNGNEVAVDAAGSRSVMEIIHDAGIDDLLAICGGCCSCATCHVYVDQAFFEKLSPMKGEENDLLDALDHRRPNSRLSCQIPFSDELDGLKVSIAPED